ncbi:hypothetical protein SDC9_152039 [bioreactor metagenome]|uniref:Uncharacterized protein n=1 Tax=bioreactor metagenome TaxID=1076179 RepID=A0A645ES00_9ZZZZ
MESRNRQDVDDAKKLERAAALRQKWILEPKNQRSSQSSFLRTKGCLHPIRHTDFPLIKQPAEGKTIRIWLNPGCLTFK